MNLLLLEGSQFTSESSARANVRQSEHIQNILKLSVGDKISLGRVDGLMGYGVIKDLDEKVGIEDIVLDKTPPPQLNLTVILGMPRPQMLKRILQTLATMGVKKICFIQSSRVEKSFWQSPSATDQAIHDQLILGLEQGVATQLPVVEKHLRFRPFIEDAMETLTKGTKKIIAHPHSSEAPVAHNEDEPLSLAIGPEGGFIRKEVEQFEARGFTSIHLGRRILKVETAVPVLLAKLYSFTC